MEAFFEAGQRPLGTRGVLEVLLAGEVDFGKEGLCCVVEILVEAGVCDEGPAQRAWCAGRSVLGERSQTRLAENMAAGLTAVRTEVDVETNGAGEAFPVLLLAVQQRTAHDLSLLQLTVQPSLSPPLFPPQTLQSVLLSFAQAVGGWRTYRCWRHFFFFFFFLLLGYAVRDGSPSEEQS